jgi:hypothetical protein
MPRLQTASQNRIALAALQDPDGYVDALLGLAREQILARSPFIVGKALAADRALVSRSCGGASRGKWH